MATEEVLFTFRFEEGAGAGGAPVGGGIPTDAAADQAARAAQGAEPAAGGGVPTEGGGATPQVIGGALGGIRGGISGSTIAAAATIAAGALAVKAVVSEMDKLTDRLKEFSPALSVEQARSEALATVQAVRQAQEIGPTLAEFQAERAELNRGINDLKVAVLKEVVPLATAILSGINKLASITDKKERRETISPLLQLLDMPFLSEENPALLSGLPFDVALELIDPLNADIPNIPPILGVR